MSDRLNFADRIRMGNEIIRLEAENAELRELAALNWEWAHSCCGSACRLRTEGCGYAIDRECNYERKVWEQMRELGVDDG